ncbi:MAG: hypothetical protein GX044_03905 [Firmicutes bacterium]|jgi:hypothetical protein|nr:hypothetical protein [Bacillota bacterium]
MKTLIVQKRLAFSPGTLAQQAGPFLAALRELVREVKDQHRDEELELADLGFIPAEDHIEVKLYFRERLEREAAPPLTAR